MKYIYLLTALVVMGCSDKTPSIEKNNERKIKIEVVEVAHVYERKKVTPKSVVPKNETLVPETKVTKKIDSDVPKSCAMWSDGCNVCTRTGGKKASCTTNPECHNKVFSCLQWQ